MVHKKLQTLHKQFKASFEGFSEKNSQLEKLIEKDIQYFNALSYKSPMLVGDPELEKELQINRLASMQ